MKRSTGATAGVCLALVLALVLSGCRKDDGRVQLSVLNYFSLATPGASAEISRVWEAFDKANPDIKVVREDAFEEPFHLTTEAYAAAGELPDVIYVWPGGRSTTLHSRGLLRDLAPFIARDGLADKFTPVSLDPANQAGGYLAMIPLGMTTTSAFYANTEVLAEAGLQPAGTYAELVAQVPVLRARGLETVIMANADTWVMQSCLFSMIAGRFGGEGWEQKILDGSAKFTDPEFVDALRFIRRMYTDGVLSQATLATSYGDTPGMFATNRGAYMIDGDWRSGAFITDPGHGARAHLPGASGKIPDRRVPLNRGREDQQLGLRRDEHRLGDEQLRSARFGPRGCGMAADKLAHRARGADLHVRKRRASVAVADGRGHSINAARAFADRRGQHRQNLRQKYGGNRLRVRGACVHPAQRRASGNRPWHPDTRTGGPDYTGGIRRLEGSPPGKHRLNPMGI